MVEHVRRIVPDSFVYGDPEQRRRIFSQCDVNLDKGPPPRLLSPDFSLVKRPAMRRRLKRPGRVKVGKRLEKPSVPSERRGRLLEGKMICSESLAVMQKGGGFAKNRDLTACTAPAKRMTPMPSLVSLHVKGLHNETFSLNVSSGQEARAVYEAVEQHTGIPTCDQLLMFSGHKVLPLLSLNDQGITAGSTLHLSLLLRGGADDPPTDGLTDKMLGRLARKIGADWKAVGLELNISDRQLKRIRADEARVDDCANEMLQTWLRNTTEHSDRVDELLTALREAELTDIAEEFERQLSAAKIGQAKAKSSASGASIEHIRQQQQQKPQVSVQHTVDEGGTEVKNAEASPASWSTSTKVSLESSLHVNDLSEKPSSDGPGASFSATEEERLSASRLNDALKMANRELTVKLLLVNSASCTSQEEGSKQMAFLSKFCWNTVFDFDPDSEHDGLYQAIINCPSPSRFKTMMVNKYLDKSITMQPSQIGLDSTVQPWVFVNGRQEFETDTLTFVEWMTQEYEALGTALQVYRDLCPCLATVLVLSSDQALEHMAATVERLTTLGLTASTDKASRLLTVITVTEDLRERLLAGVPRLSDMLRPHCFVAPLDEMSRIFTNVSNSRPLSVTNFAVSEFVRLPRPDGGTIAVPQKIVGQWVDLRVLSSCQCVDENITDSRIINAANEFYKGHEVTWLNFYLEQDVTRSQFKDFLKKIRSQAEEVEKLRPSEKKTPHMSTVRIVKLIYESGTGGTTLARRLLWELRVEYRCAIVQCLSITTCNSITSFQRYGEQTVMKPAILLVDREPLLQLRCLVDQLRRTKACCVILFVQPQQNDDSTLLLGSHQPEVPEDSLHSEELLLKHKLDKIEQDLVKSKIRQLEDHEKRSKAVQAVEKAGLFIYAGLELFGQQYNEKRLVKFVDDRLGNHEVTVRHRQMLEFCSLVFFFIHKSIPRGCFDMQVTGMHFFSQGFLVDQLCPAVADLLVKYEDTLEQSCVYLGYRPAHVRVAELILDKRPLDQICTDFLNEMLTGSSYATQNLWELTNALFIRRASSTNSHLDNYEPDHVEGEALSPVESSVPRRRHRQSQESSKVLRFTSLVNKILDQTDERGDGATKALQLLLLLCEKAKARNHHRHAFIWQVISRLMSYCIEDCPLPPGIAERVNLLMDRSALPTGSPDLGGAESSILQHISGFKAAVVCINQALLIEPKHSTLLSTKGNILKHRLTNEYGTRKGRSEGGCSAKELHSATRLGIDACQAFEEARSARQGNWHGTVGDIETCLCLLRIVKSSQDLSVGYPAADFLRFLRQDFCPQRFQNHLSEDGSLEFLLSMEKRIISLFDGFYVKEQLIQEQVYGEETVFKWQDSLPYVQKLEENFLSLVGEKQNLHKDKGKASPQQRERTVRGMLASSKESPYSSWRSLSEKSMLKIIRHLQPLAEKGEVTNHGSMTALVRACFECKTTPMDLKLSETLPTLITKWVSMCKSIDGAHKGWAHLFNYIVHFPHDQAPKWANVKVAKESLQICPQSVYNQQMHGESSRRPKPMYFLTKKPMASGFPLIPARSVGDEKKDPDFRSESFWRSPAVSEQLQRLSGFKEDVGVIRMRGFHLKFDNDLYPHRGQDKVFFYVGFSFRGPYAFDPISQVQHEQLSKPASCLAKSRMPPAQHLSSPTAGLTASKAKVDANQMSAQPLESQVQQQLLQSVSVQIMKTPPADCSNGSATSVALPRANVDAQIVEETPGKVEHTGSEVYETNLPLQGDQVDVTFQLKAASQHPSQPLDVSSLVQDGKVAVHSTAKPERTYSVAVKSTLPAEKVFTQQTSVPEDDLPAGDHSVDATKRRSGSRHGKSTGSRRGKSRGSRHGKSTGRQKKSTGRGKKSREEKTEHSLSAKVRGGGQSSSRGWQAVQGRKGKDHQSVSSQSKALPAHAASASSSRLYQHLASGCPLLKLSNRFGQQSSSESDSSSEEEDSPTSEETLS